MITFIGGGNMASALIKGLLSKSTAATDLQVIDPNDDARMRLQAMGVRTASVIDATLSSSDIVVLAVKPQQMRVVVAALKPYLKDQLVLSIAAGIRAVDLSRWLDGYGAIIRSMPNTPALVGQGITGMVALTSVSAAQRQQADVIMCAVGSTLWLENEALLDAVTALSGSGPAYVFYFIEAMQQAGVGLGLTPQQATELSIATFRGAAQLATQATEPLAVLRERVTSKGGTTHAALSSLQDNNVAQSIMQAVNAAAARSQSLGDEFGHE
jgi:pyrroline-5-carboxylate reductase